MRYGIGEESGVVMRWKLSVDEEGISDSSWILLGGSNEECLKIFLVDMILFDLLYLDRYLEIVEFDWKRL